VIISLFFINYGLKELDEPATFSIFRTALFSLVLLWSHALAFVFSWLVLATLSLYFSRKKVVWLFASALPSLLCLMFWRLQPKTAGFLTQPSLWEIGWHRIVEIPQSIVGLENDPASRLITGGLVLSFLLFPKRLNPKPIFLLPLSLVLALCLFGPFRLFFGPHYFAQRFSVYIVPFLMASLAPVPDDKPSAIPMYLVGGLFLIWIGILSARFQNFNRETKSFDAIVDSMESGKKLIASIRDTDSETFAFLPYAHFAAYYQVFKDGLFEYSFANYPQQVVTYKPGLDLSPIKYGHTWEKTSMASGYDYFLVRSKEDEVARLNPEAQKNFALKKREGEWWLFELRSKPPPAP
jgi:hypothetical protein